MATPPVKGWTKDHDALARENGHPSWEAWVETIEERLGYAVCGARKRAATGPCGLAAGWGIEGSDWGRCKKHGGGGVKNAGPANGNWRDGSYSTAVYRLRGSLAETRDRLEAEVEDVFDLAVHGRILQARMVDVLSNTPETPVTAKLLGGILSDLIAEAEKVASACESGEESEILAAAESLGALCQEAIDGPLSDGELQSRAWKEWGRMLDQMRLLTRTQSLQEARRYGPVTWADVLVVVDRVRVGVLQYVPDESKGDALRFFRNLSQRPASQSLN